MHFTKEKNHCSECCKKVLYAGPKSTRKFLTNSLNPTRPKKPGPTYNSAAAYANAQIWPALIKNWTSTTCGIMHNSIFCNNERRAFPLNSASCAPNLINCTQSHFKALLYPWHKSRGYTLLVEFNEYFWMTTKLHM